MSEDADLGEVRFDRVFNAPRELVFRCMTTPEDLAQFWGPEGVHTPLENITVELRVGGIFETIMVNDATGEEYPSRGVCVEVDPPSRFVFREFDNADGIVTAIDFIDQGDGTTRCLTVQSNVPAMYRTPEAQAGMESAFRQFDQYLATLV